METPPDLQSALDESDTARAVYELLPPSHQREYIDWIEEAKKPETRSKRIKATIERLVGK